MPNHHSDNLLSPGHNCRTVSRFHRLGFLIDGYAYFEALIDTLSKARRRIMILGWDFDPRTPLRPHLNPTDLDSDLVLPLGRFLLNLVEKRAELEIYVLIWRNSVLYGSNPIPMSFGAEEWWEHPRIHFHLDDHHPLGASHHQKIVTVDDKLAFVGGMDLTQGRWDTPDHAPHEPGRVDTFGNPYPPVHDIQFVVDGDAARTIASVAEDRWRFATGETFHVEVLTGDPWPSTVSPNLRDQTLAVATTQPEHGEQPERREVEALNAAVLKTASDYIYIESQYFALPEMADILTSHLRRPAGPEIVLIVTQKSSGMVEHYVMAENRDRLFRLLQGADSFGRLRMYFPVSCPDPMCEVKIHSKLLIVDDHWVKAGSSNINARSVGLDSECDVAYVAHDGLSKDAIRALRDTLIAEHLGVSPALFSQTQARAHSFIAAIEALNCGKRCLLPFKVESPATEISMATGSGILDPSQPYGEMLGKLTGSQ